MKKLLILILSASLMGCGEEPEPKIDGKWEIVFPEITDPDMILSFQVNQESNGTYTFIDGKFGNSGDVSAKGAGVTITNNKAFVDSEDMDGNRVDIQFEWNYKNGNLKFTSYQYRVYNTSGASPVITSDNTFTGSYSATRIW